MNRHYTLNKQNGAVLIVSLVILLIMTMLGISSMQTTTMEERMSANTQNHAITFQAAESAISNAISNDIGFIASPAAGPQTLPPDDLGMGTTDAGTIILTSQATINYIGIANKPGASIGRFMAQQFEITGLGSMQGSGATSVHLQGIDRTAFVAPN